MYFVLCNLTLPSMWLSYVKSCSSLTLNEWCNCVRFPKKTAELLPSCRQRPRWGSQRNGLTAKWNSSKPPVARTVFLTVPAGPLLVNPLRFVLMRTRSTKKSRFSFRISVSPFKFKLLLAAESVLNSSKHLAELKRALQQFTEHDFGDIVHFLSILFHLIFFGSVCLVGCSVVRAGPQRNAKLIYIPYSLILAACLIRNVAKLQ